MHGQADVGHRYALAKTTDIRVREAALYFLPVKMRVPLKFGSQTVTGALCARARVVVEDRSGRRAEGWGETPLSVAWVWPSALGWEERERRMSDFCVVLAREVAASDRFGHPMELGDALQRERLDILLAEANAGRGEAMPHLAGLVCHSVFDLAIFDAFGELHRRPVFDMLGAEFLSTDLATFLDGDQRFSGSEIPQFLRPRQARLPVWHLVGGLDPLESSDLTGSEPQDGHPAMLREWIQRDGLKCLKVKLRGNDERWDYERLVRVGAIAGAEGCDWLSADFNCTVTDPAYVCEILDRLLVEHPRFFGMLLYIEQPFPYDLEAHRMDVRSVSARKPLFLDESAHDWRFVRLGQELGWTGVALKTCKTLTGALLSLAWARAHGMTLMVQDLTNPMLALVPHALLAAHAGTIMGVECNAMQFYPEASLPEAAVHPGLYQRRKGVIDLSSLGGTGFGYRIGEIHRELPACAAAF